MGFGKTVYEWTKKADGFYVDVGANDGIRYTETKELEDIGWNGICIEAHPTLFEQLKNNRKAICHQAIVYKDDGEHEFGFQEARGCGSGLLENMPEKHITGSDTPNMVDMGMKRDIVTTTRLETILDMHDAPAHIDFLKIDTEGSDFIILQSLSYTKYTYDYIVIENAWNDMDQVIKYMKTKNYKHVPAGQGDTFFVLNKVSI